MAVLRSEASGPHGSALIAETMRRQVLVSRQLPGGALILGPRFAELADKLGGDGGSVVGGGVVVVVDAGKDTGGPLGAEPLRECRHIHVVPGLIALDDEVRLDPQGLGRRGDEASPTTMTRPRCWLASTHCCFPLLRHCGDRRDSQPPAAPWDHKPPHPVDDHQHGIRMATSQIAETISDKWL